MSLRPMFIIAALVEGAGRYAYVMACRFYKATRVYAVELKMLSNYRLGILKHKKPIDIYRRIFFEFLFVLIATIGCFYSAVRYFFQPSFSTKFQFSFIQPLHRFIAGEPLSIFWRKDLWYVSEFFHRNNVNARPGRMYTVSWLLSMLVKRS